MPKNWLLLLICNGVSTIIILATQNSITLSMNFLSIDNAQLWGIALITDT